MEKKKKRAERFAGSTTETGAAATAVEANKRPKIEAVAMDPEQVKKMEERAKRFAPAATTATSTSAADTTSATTTEV